MNIAVIGAGRIGSTLIRQLSTAGHQVRVANRRGPQTLDDLAAETGAQATTLAKVTENAQLVIVSVPPPAIPQLGLRLPAEAIVVDTGNYVPHFRDGTIADLDEAT